MSECASVSYRGYRITAAARLNPVAGDCWQLQPVYKPLALIAWRSGGKPYEKRLDDPKHVFPDPQDALKVALALAKRYIDQLDHSRCPPDTSDTPDVDTHPVPCPESLAADADPKSD